jgi:hypothetical protein
MKGGYDNAGLLPGHPSVGCELRLAQNNGGQGSCAMATGHAENIRPKSWMHPEWLELIPKMVKHGHLAER